ncbi:hypothetical protein [Fodinicola feengrottensis]|uniref:hypothetical protein n=1 Tax=Fodinicola feengrottensis TaxID=435914 RepID=UPI0013D4E5AE|nr:hypothetical protein [Fodinicola feengrottensis]
MRVLCGSGWNDRVRAGEGVRVTGHRLAFVDASGIQPDQVEMFADISGKKLRGLFDPGDSGPLASRPIRTYEVETTRTIR